MKTEVIRHIFQIEIIRQYVIVINKRRVAYIVNGGTYRPLKFRYGNISVYSIYFCDLRWKMKRACVLWKGDK